MAHTPGPWKAESYDDAIWRGPGFGSPDDKIVGYKTRHYVTATLSPPEVTVLVCEINQTVRNPLRPPADERADALLIASAPDLLAALERIVATCGHTSSAEEQALIKGRAAIARAKGS